MYSKRIKNFLTGQHIANWVYILLLIVLAFLLMSRWRIICIPQKENNWVAIGAIGGWASATISGIAIWFAASVPKKIAVEQNKIALFEKRYECYHIFLKYISFANSIYCVETCGQLHDAFKFNFIESNDEINIKNIVMTIRKDEKKMMAALFLFPDFCDGITIKEMLQCMLNIVELVQFKKLKYGEYEKKKITLFYSCCSEFNEKYMEKMRKQMLI